MKFGKTIQSQQVPGWGGYYLNYKALKKIINSYAAGRPASDASLLSLGLRPSKRTLSHSHHVSRPASRLPEPQHSLDSPDSLASLGAGSPLGLSATSIPTISLGASSSSAIATPSSRHVSSMDIGVAAAGNSPAQRRSGDLDPLPPETEPPAGSRSSGMLSHGTGGGTSRHDRNESFKAHRDVFFFTLQRELEKINAFYLIKERDLRLRLLTLLTNRKRLVQHASRGGHGHSDPSDDPDAAQSISLELNEDGSRKNSVEWTSLEEAWRLFERDLGKLQGFIEINATGFRKILKKWDKRSKSNTKEMYLERQVEVQPCFNRDFIAKLSDIVAANLLDLEAGAGDHLQSALFADLPESAGERKVDFDADAGQALAMDALVDLEASLVKALGAGPDAMADWLKVAKARQHRGSGHRVMRVLWRAALHVPEDCLDMVLNTLDLDFGYIDNINGRTPLHHACIAGSSRVVELCVQVKPDLLEAPDAYDRRPLHYAAMHGHSRVVSFLLSSRAESAPTDMDGYTPLMYAITRGHLEVVQIFVNGRIAMEPTAMSNDLIPLSLACQSGHVEVARLLLRSGAKVLPNSEGLYPQHFAAKAGHEAICQLLVDEGGADGGGKDRADKYNLWTPLHHAAVGGEPRHLACMKVLVAAGCDVNAADEYGKSPGWYAAWYGHVDCLNFLMQNGARLTGKGVTLEGMESLGLAADPQMDGLSPGSDLELDKAEGGEEFELIPSLSLPPPIIPLRVYGHEFLAERCLVQVSLGHPFSRATSPKLPPIKLYSRSSQDPLHLWSSLKLVMTSKSDVTAVPHSVILPLPDEREVFSFQVSDLDRFTLELSLYPTFGSKVIGRAIVLPSTFADIRYHKGFVAPLLDHHLKTIGEVAFEVSCIRPFEGAQLEIGGRVETYWKSKVTPTAPSTQDHAHQYQAHRPLSVSTSSPGTAARGAAPSAASTGPAKESALVTGSSLSGEYVSVVVQVTKDLVPVAYPEWTLPIPGLDIGVSDVTSPQFLSVAASSRRQLSDASAAVSNAAQFYERISSSLTTLQDVLQFLPADLGINLKIRYARESDSARYGVGRSPEVNSVVDAVLKVIYEDGKRSAAAGRKIVFSSFDPTVCTALNWKQPNYAVFFSSYCGISKRRTSATGEKLVQASVDEESDMRCLSVREAVNFAKQTNLLGVILEATTLAAVPSLVASVKDVGLLLATFGDQADMSALRSVASDGKAVDAFVVDGVMTLSI